MLGPGPIPLTMNVQKGHEFSADLISPFSELNDDELEGVAGGKAIGYGDTERPQSIIDDGKC